MNKISVAQCKRKSIRTNFMRINGQVNNADPADPADLAILVRDIKVRIIQFDLGETE